MLFVSITKTKNPMEGEGGRRPPPQQLEDRQISELLDCGSALPLFLGGAVYCAWGQGGTEVPQSIITP
jgi:hypothetical protein